jgi:hypothetical protein
MKKHGRFGEKTRSGRAIASKARGKKRAVADFGRVLSGVRAAAAHRDPRAGSVVSTPRDLPRARQGAKLRLHINLTRGRMITLPMIAVQSLAAGLGGYCLLLWFRKARKPVLIGFHLIAGLAGTEVLMATIHISDLPAESPLRTLGIVAGAWFGVSIISGLLAPLVGKGHRRLANSLLALHVFSGVVGFGTALAFAVQV